MSRVTEDRDAILILGGGTMQLPAIREARNLKLCVHVADGNPECPGRNEADHFHNVDLRDRPGLVECAGKIPRLRGVFTAGTDFSTSVAAVSDALRLPGVSAPVARAATDKGEMRRRLSAAGVRVPAFQIFSGADSITPTTVDRAIQSLGLPVVCKPVDNMGARGVQLAESLDGALAALQAAQKLSPSKTAIIEQRIDGPEFSLDAVVVEGRVRITGIGRRHVFFPPYFVELGHTIPADLAAAETAALEETFTAAIHAIGIRSGAAKGDVFLQPAADGNPVAVVGEIAARLSGGYMSGWTYPIATGVPLTRLALRISLGETPSSKEFLPRRHRVSAERAVLSIPGTVAAVELPDGWRDGVTLPCGVEALFLTCRVGDQVAPPRNNVEKVANVIAAGNTAAEADKRAVDAVDQIRVRLRRDDPSTMEYLCSTGWNGPWARYTMQASDLALLADRPHYAGSPVLAAPLPVRRWSDRRRAPLMYTDQPLPCADELLQRLELEGLVRFAAQEPALDGLFWRAFLAGGRQGVEHLLNLKLEDLPCGA